MSPGFPQTPSSVFWRELALATPRPVVFHRESAGDPQTVLQDDKDPMLTLDPDYLDCRADTDPAGDLGRNSKGLLSRTLLTKRRTTVKRKRRPDVSIVIFSTLNWI